MQIMRISHPALALLATLAMQSAAQTPEPRFGGAGWFQFGRVERSQTIGTGSANDYNKNWMQSAGAQVNSSLRIDEHWDAAMGLGVVQVHLMRGARSNANWYPFYVPYVAEARITYSTPLVSETDQLQLTVGNFPYAYSSDAHNLGQYLLRGYVYPGALVSGFGNIYGGLARYRSGGFRNDLILKSEAEDKPQFDFSVANITTYQVAPGFEIGAGVNFYRLLPQDSKLTSPNKDCEDDLGPYAGGTQRNPCYVIDTSGSSPDTVTVSLAGTKVMARFSLDPKILFGWMGAAGRPWGKQDWIVYGEAALLGIKDYPVYYDDKARRIPVMVGFNIPAWGYLDNLSLEVEYYASKNSSDNLAAQNGSAIPVVNPDVNNARDDWKWSLQAGKVLMGNLKLSAQVANDHSRLGGSHDLATGVEAYTTPKDWYWTCKLAYFF